MDSAGRIVLPKSVRQQAGLEPGAPLDVACRDGRVEIEPAPAEVRLERQGRFWVAVPLDARSPLSVSAVRRTLEAVRERRDR
jgi:AbrB family looped-hinge helix DNA binding protein